MKDSEYNKSFVLYPRPLMWWNYFLLFYMCHSAMGLTRCYKTVVFLHLYVQFFTSTAVLPIFRFSKQVTAMWNYIYQSTELLCLQ